MKNLKTFAFIGFIAGTTLIINGCQRPHASAETDVIATEETVTQVEVIEVISSTAETEDIDRQWLPPAESRLSTIDVPLSEIRQHVEESRKTAQEALVSSDNAVIEPAQKQLDETHTAIYGLAVRMRPEWTQMEFQSFMRDLRYHQFLDLKHALDKRRSSLSHEAWLWANTL